MFIFTLWSLVVEMEATKKTCEALEASSKYEIKQAKKTIQQSHKILALAA